MWENIVAHGSWVLLVIVLGGFLIWALIEQAQAAGESKKAKKDLDETAKRFGRIEVARQKVALRGRALYDQLRRDRKK